MRDEKGKRGERGRDGRVRRSGLGMEYHTLRMAEGEELRAVLRNAALFCRIRTRNIFHGSGSATLVKWGGQI